MVLAVRTKNRSTSVQVHYLIHIQEITPWPPSQSLKSLRSVVLQWENGDRKSGCTSPVAPSLGSGIGDGKIEFNESFRLPLTLSRDMHIRGSIVEAFQKNCLELNLFESRRDKTIKGQSIATAIIDLAEYGVAKDAFSVSAPMNCKRSFKNTAQPILFLKIQPIDRGRLVSTSSRELLRKEISLDRNGGESVSDLMNEEYAEEAEISSITDDDVSTYSVSSAHESNGVSTPQREQNASEMMMKNNTGENIVVNASAAKLGLEDSKVIPVIPAHDNVNGRASSSSSVDLSFDVGSPVNGEATIPSFPAEIIDHSFKSPSSSSIEATEEESNGSMRSNDHEDLAQCVPEKDRDFTSEIKGNSLSKTEDETVILPATEIHTNENLGIENAAASQVKGEDETEATTCGYIQNGSIDDTEEKKQLENGQETETPEEKLHNVEDDQIISRDSARKQENLEMKSILINNRLKHVKSVRSLLDSARSNGLASNNQFMDEVRDDGVQGAVKNVAQSFVNSERTEPKVGPKEPQKSFSNTKIQQMEHRINMLEGELREAAAIEVSLFAVIAEHGSSANKVHAPARRLCRLYFHACEKGSQLRRASAARSAVSGLVLVAKACGNDVPRLSFWLSNAVVLRAIISQSFQDQKLQVTSGPGMGKNGGLKGNDKKPSPLKWKESSHSKEKYGSLEDWEDPRTFATALEKVEAWIFSRIIESVWWQTLTPHMQSAATMEIDKDQGNFSLELWKKAFKDVCERICPVRAGGHECGCLRLLVRLIMEQCVTRLDVAMFNGILRESDDEIPTDPVSDPISDPKVLPIPPGTPSFGAGAQLKNAIGNWSRWLTELIGLDDDDSHGDENGDECFNSFHLLDALSDLMMLPKDMLLSRNIREEVCPMFSVQLIKRVVDNFVPDEFCPDPIPEVVLEALGSEDGIETGEESITNFPCNAPPIVYSPPLATSLKCITGESENRSHLRRSGSSILRKSYTSDDELDELDSPLSSITKKSFKASPKTKPNRVSDENGRRNAVRYQLLREVWMNSE